MAISEKTLLDAEILAIEEINEAGGIIDNIDLSNKKNIPLAGGLFILFPIVFFLNDLYLNFFIISIYLIGLFSDRKILVSPKNRFFIQCLLVLIFVAIFDIKINSSRIELFDVIPDIVFMDAVVEISDQCFTAGCCS